MTKQEARTAAYHKMMQLSKELKELSEEANRDIVVLNISQWLESTARTKFRLIHRDRLKVRTIPNKEPKKAKVENIPNRDIIADSSNNEISQDAEKKSRFGRGQKGQVEELHKQGKSIAEISDILNVEEIRVAEEVGKLK